MERNSIHGSWSSRWAFILAATGSAVGLGNIWKFPYITGQYGGAAFLLVFLLFIVILGLPIMMSEMIVGRRGRRNPINAMRMLAREERVSSFWRFPGYAGVIAGFLILSYYSVVSGEVGAYIFRTASGMFENQSADGVKSILYDFQHNIESMLAWHTIFMVMTMTVVARGVRSGLEKTVKILVPLMVACLVILVLYGTTLGSFGKAVDFMFVADFDRLFYQTDEAGKFLKDAAGNKIFTMDGVLTALGHAFFTLSLGMGAIMVYGSYLRQDISISKSAATVAIADTVIAILAGLAVFPIVFEHNLQPDSGPSLIFETLPIAFGSMGNGAFFGALFFLLLLLAAWTSAISLIEPAVSRLIEKRNMTRVQACVWLGVAVWLLGIASIYSAAGVSLGDMMRSFAGLFGIHEPEISNSLFAVNWFMVIDSITAKFLLPLGGLAVVLFVGWRMSLRTVCQELGLKSRLIKRLWILVARFITPFAVITVFVVGIISWFS